MAQVANAKGRVVLKAVVETDGRVSDVQPSLNAEALRVVKRMEQTLDAGQTARQARAGDIQPAHCVYAGVSRYFLT